MMIYDWVHNIVNKYDVCMCGCTDEIEYIT